MENRIQWKFQSNFSSIAWSWSFRHNWIRRFCLFWLQVQIIVPYRHTNQEHPEDIRQTYTVVHNHAYMHFVMASRSILHYITLHYIKITIATWNCWMEKTNRDVKSSLMSKLDSMESMSVFTTGNIFKIMITSLKFLV